MEVIQPVTYVINLDRNPARLKATKSVLAAAGLSFTRVPAVDGRRLEADAGNAALGTLGRTLSCGEVGCFESHRLCAKKFFATGLPYGLVVEDDLALRPMGKSQLDHLWASLEHIHGWDVMNLGKNAKRFCTPLLQPGWKELGTTHYRAHYFPMTTPAILWSRAGASTFLDLTQQITMPVDLFLRNWTLTTGRGMAFAPSPFTVRGEESEIDKMQATQGSRCAARNASYLPQRIKRQIQGYLLARKSQKAWA
ncbi:glycosyltransferase family 25 protein [Parasedimentitalea psychrophila]|uniref:Glycosyltransferase family 25 protein n=1 Tax=Parasedimentitalea psychrophila TaxID=2997337 RepID=A0A9Y2L461_9RHOB|nr:glycosyltransferase family 25 protein [Parasedimentitalea psychrophila]WIY27351.1 glycosyltransferase family 25 protein [Parasedimentitalea psychrophila]